MRNYGRTFAIAAALGIVGFFAAIGLMSVLFTSQTDTFAPKNSADAAGWVQAIGSIIAILASYHLGSRQAAEARRQETERLEARAAKQHSMGTLVQTSTDEVLHLIELMLPIAATPAVIDMFAPAKAMANTALTTLQAIPMTDVDPPAMGHIAGIISGLQDMQEAMNVLQSQRIKVRESLDISPFDVARSVENYCFFFKHKLKYQAAKIHDHLSALGFPSSRAHPMHEVDKVEPTGALKAT